MSERTPSRRQILRTAGIATVGGLAGCSEIGANTGTTNDTTTTAPDAGGTGETTDGGSVSVPAPGDPTYRGWIDGSTDAEGDPNFLRAAAQRYIDHDQFRAAGGNVPDGFEAHLRRKVVMDYFGVGFDRISRTMWGGHTVVVGGQFTRGEVVDGLAGTGYAPAGTHRGFELFAREDGPRAIAAGDGVVVQSSDDPLKAGPVEVVRPHVDVIAGSTQPLHEKSDLFAQTTDRAGAYPWTAVGAIDTMPETASTATIGYTFEESRTFCRTVSGFRKASDASATAVVDAAHWYLGSPYDLVSSGTEGRVAHATFVVEQGAYGEAFGTGERGDPGEYPLATFGAEYDADVGRVAIRHEAGEPVPAHLLSVSVTGPDGSRSPDLSVSGDVTPGSSIPVEASPGETVSLVWKSPGSATHALVQYEVPSGS